VEWQAIVDDMRDKGAAGSDDDAKQTVAYLTKYFGRVNVNTASAEELQHVLDLSQSDATTIVAWRASHPAFASIDDLKSVTGIDAAKIERGKNRIVFKGER
jgi:competence protein ComEA